MILGLSAFHWMLVSVVLLVMVIFIANWLADSNTVNRNLEMHISEVESRNAALTDNIYYLKNRLLAFESPELNKPKHADVSPSRQNVYEQTKHGVVADSSCDSSASSSISSCIDGSGF